jgi:integrase
MAIKKTSADHYQVDFRDQTGHRIRKTFDTWKAANEFDKQTKGAVSKGDFIAPSKDTVSECAEAWLKKKEAASGYRHGTLGNWHCHIEQYIKPTLGDLRIQQIEIEHIEQAAVTWKDKTSAYTANVVLRTLTAIFELAQRSALRGKPNNAALADRIKLSNEEEQDGAEEVKAEDVYDPEELKKLIDGTTPGTLERALVMVPALLGLRIGEVLGLTWPALDLKGNVLHVRSALVDVGKAKGGRALKAVKSKSSRRGLDLPAQLTLELKRWKLKCPPSAEGFVFCNPEGKPLHRKAAMHILDAAITAAGLERRLTLHKLRHTFASLLLANGVDLPKVTRLLGHKDSTITLRVYSHFIKGKTQPAQDLADFVLG